MPFFAPVMLFGLAAAAAPVLLHLLRRRSARRLVWGAWRFLAESMRSQRRRILLEDVVLMVVRTATLVFAALAFARPFLPETGFFGGGDKDVVIVLDRSGSMNLKRGDGTTAFDAALAEARDLVERSPRGVSFGLVAAGRDAEILTATPFSSRREILDLFDRVKPGEDTMDAPRALEAAGEVLSGGSHPVKQIVVFGDGQGYGWRHEDANAWRRVENVFSAFNRRPSVVWRVLEKPSSVKNAAIAAVSPSRRIFGTDRPLTFSVTVVNSGSVAFSPGELAMEVDGKRVASQPVGQILPGLSRTIPFSCRIDRTGDHTVVTSLAAGDDIASDNVVTNPVKVIDELKVLLVNGRPGAAGFDRPTAYVEAALRPEMKGDKIPFLVKPVNVRPGALETTNVFQDVAVTILCDVPFLSEKAADNLAAWTDRGGGLLAVPGERSEPSFYTNWTWRSRKVMPAAWTNFSVVAANAKPPLFDGAAVAGRMLFDESAVATNEVEILSRMNDGEIAAVAGAFGRGRVGMLAMPLDLGWSALPARPGFVMFVHELVYSLSSVKSVDETRDAAWSAREGDVSPLSEAAGDAVSSRIDLSTARLKDDALAAVAGRSFGVEVWRPLAVIALLLIFAEMLICRFIDRSRAGDSPAPPPSRLRFALRAVAVLALVWMLAHVVWVHDRRRRVSRKVAVLVDASRSMLRRDLDDNGRTNLLSRFDIATNAAARIEKSLSARYDVESFSFGGGVTDFAAALEDVRSRIPADELAGAVFVTDGRPTAGPAVEPVARLFARQGAKISSVIVGSATNRPDVALQDVFAPDAIFLGDRVRVQVAVAAHRMKGAKIAVNFIAGGKTLEREELQVDSDEWTAELRFADEPKSRGVHSYRVTLETPPADSEQANNDWPFDVAVSDDRTNVLIADRRPRWEFRYLRNLFYGRDKSVHLQYLLCQPDRVDGEAKSRPVNADATRAFGDAESGGLPSGRDAWRKFDVMVFGDLAPELFAAADIGDIRYCIEERGATAVFIAGERYMPLAYAKNPLAELLPVTFTNADGRVTAGWRQGAFGFTVTGAGLAHEIMRLSDSDAENARIWETGCEWQRRLDGLAARPGAETLAFAGDSSALKSPLLAVGRRGRGKVVFLAGDETWRFRYRIGDTYHHRFWGNVLRWGAGVKLRDGNAFVRVGTDRLHYPPGERVRLRVRFSDADFMPVNGVSVSCTAVDPRGVKCVFPLADRGAGNGVYEGEYAETWELGDYRLQIDCPAVRRRLGDKWPTNAVTAFSVKDSFAPVEYAELASDRALPAEMAETTGGVVLSPDGAPAKLAAAFGAGSSEATEHVESHVWNHPAAFTALAFALIAVWMLRKRKGLS